jgi:hypothetical protein
MKDDIENWVRDNAEIVEIIGSEHRHTTGPNSA